MMLHGKMLSRILDGPGNTKENLGRVSSPLCVYELGLVCSQTLFYVRIARFAV